MTQFLDILPWMVLLVVYIGEKLQQWSDRSQQWSFNGKVLERAQLPQAPAPAPPVLPPMPSATPIPPKPAAAPGPFADAPKWFQLALHEIGFHEIGNNQGIGRYIAMAHCGAEGDPWCAIFANAMLEQAGLTGTRSPSSQSFRSHPGFVQLTSPALGAIVVFWRGAQDSGLGHVGFYRGEDSGHVWTLGGNENDMVQIEALPKSSASFGLIGYWWPKAVPLPTGGAVLMPTGTPISIQAPPAGVQASAPSTATPGRQTGITATMFGGQQSAYGGPIDDNSPGVALPFRFTGERPTVLVTSKAASIECSIVDVGPWNISDPYWQTGTRPQAESGTDLTGRKTNRAGIDLTLAAAKTLQIDGKGLVDWEFVQSPLAPTPTVT